jgi:hypothetical protein
MMPFVEFLPFYRQEFMEKDLWCQLWPFKSYLCVGQGVGISAIRCTSEQLCIDIKA